ncbi:hypothetical protein [Niallia sp. FSL M8-0099]|uniref:hypothetical protein n=1 Tax=Niallia sp. FSL M8-0099 TaxID=2954519 RepID=UPI0030FBBDC0
MATTTTLDRELLMDLIQKNTGWSESVIRSFSADSLKEIYGYILRKHLVTKARITYTGEHGLRIHIPVRIREKLNLKDGDRFGIKTSSEREVLLDPNSDRLIVKMNKNGRVPLPIKLIDRKILKEIDDVLVRVVNGKIILKSFTYFQ